MPDSIRLGKNRVDTIATHASILGDRCTCFFRIVKERTASPVKRPEVSLVAYLRSLGNLNQATVSFFILLPSSFQSGGGERDRTDDLLLAKQALSQLSYGPAILAPRRIPLRLRSLLVGGSGWIRTIDPRLIKTVL